MTDHLKGLTITTLGALFVVPDSLFVRLIGAEPLVVAFWRGFVSGLLIIAGVLLLQGTKPFTALIGTGRYGFIFVLAAGGSGVLFVLAVSLTSIANVVLIIATLPVFAAIYSRLFLAEPITLRMLITMAAVAVGLVVIAHGSGDTHSASLAGDTLALAVSALFAAGLTAARRVKHVSMVPAIPVGYLLAALLLLPFINPFDIEPDKWLLVPMHGLFIVISATLLALGPRYISSAEVSLLVLLESVLAPLLAWLVIDEHPGNWTLLGGMIIISALGVSNAVVMLRRKR